MAKIKTFLGRHKKLCVLLAVLAVLYLGYNLVLKPRAAAAAAETQATVQTLTLERGEIRSTLSASGTITSGTVCEVSTTLTYPVAELKVAVGDRVNEGDVIALLDTESLDADIATHQKEQNASAQKAQMAVDQAARRLEDAKNKKKIDEERWGEMDEDSWNDLLRSDSLAIEDAQDALNGAILDQQSQSSNELQKLYQNKADCTITAPKAGVITSLAKVGGTGSIATIEDPAQPLLEVSIKEFDINRLKTGQAVNITTGAQDTFSGTVNRIAPKAQKNSSGESLFPVQISFSDATEAIKLGMSAKAQIVLDSRENVFVVPLAALGTDQEGNPVVYAKQPDGSFEPMPVTTGLESDFEAEISGEGLSEGMEIQSLAPEMGE